MHCAECPYRRLADDDSFVRPLGYLLEETLVVPSSPEELRTCVHLDVCKVLWPVASSTVNIRLDETDSRKTLPVELEPVESDDAGIEFATRDQGLNV